MTFSKKHLKLEVSKGRPDFLHPEGCNPGKRCCRRLFGLAGAAACGAAATAPASHAGLPSPTTISSALGRVGLAELDICVMGLGLRPDSPHGQRDANDLKMENRRKSLEAKMATIQAELQQVQLELKELDLPLKVGDYVKDGKFHGWRKVQEVRVDPDRSLCVSFEDAPMDRCFLCPYTRNLIVREDGVLGDRDHEGITITPLFGAHPHRDRPEVSNKWENYEKRCPDGSGCESESQSTSKRKTRE